MSQEFNQNGMPRREFLRRTAGGAAALGAAGLTLQVASRSAGAAPISFTFVTPFGFLVGYAPVLVAKNGGFFEKQGLDVTIYGGRGAAMAVQQVLSGQALLSRTGGVDLIKAVANTKAPLVSVGVIDQGSPFYVVSKAGKEIKNPKDMVGKTVGIVSKGGAVENLLDIMLINNGIDPKDVPRQVVGNSPGAFGLIDQGRIDCYIISVGSVVALRLAGTAIHAWNTDEHAPIPGQVYVTSREDAEKQPDTIVKFLRALLQSIDFIANDKALGKTFDLMKSFEIAEMKDLKVAAEALKAEFALWDEAGAQYRLRHIPEKWQTAVDLMAKAKMIEPAKADVFYTNSFIDKARA